MQGKAKLVLLITLFIFGTSLLSPAKAQIVDEQYRKVRAAIDAGDRATAIQQLRSMQQADAKSFAANNFDYLLARLSEQSGDNASAQANYDAAIARNSVLAGYSFWHLAQMARASGDLILERERLRRFIATNPGLQQQEAATLRLGESFSESKDDSGTIATLRTLVSSSNIPIARETMVLTAQALRRAGKVNEARALFARVLMQMPDASRPDDFALVSVTALDEMDSAANAAGISEADHLLRASVYHFNRNFPGARKHYQAVVQNNPQGPTAPNAIYQLGRGYYLEGQYDEALKYFQRVLKEFPESSSARDALSFSAGAYNRQKRTDEAVAAYKDFLQRFPDAPNPERTYINIIDALHEAGRHKEALNWVQQTRTKFQGNLGATLALFAQMRINLAQNNWAGVVADAEQLKKSSDLGGTRVPSGTTVAEVTFLQAFALEQVGRTAEAIELYLSIPDGRNEYYGQRATQRLQALATDPKTLGLIQPREQSELATAKASPPDKARLAATSALRLSTSDATRSEALQLLRTSYQSLPAYSLPVLNQVPLGRQSVINDGNAPTSTIVDELFFLGLYDEAVTAYIAMHQPAQITSITGPSADLNYTLAMLSLRGGLANRAVRFGEAVWKSVPADYVLELAPREFAELLYPAPYRESLVKHAPSRGVDPRLVLAIARQESRFMFDAKSVAAARGMMQFIPETANEMARQLGKKEFQQDELYDPDTAILFGAHYLASLFKQFPGQFEAVIASYNGGPDNVARWVGRSRSTVPERYVPEVGFTQTKDYVFRVMTNLRAYRQLYPQLQ